MHNLQTKKSAIDLPELADQVHLDIDELFPIIEALSVLTLAHVSEGDITMTETGKLFVDASIEDRKVLFAQMIIEHIPLASYTINILKEQQQRQIDQDDILEVLRNHFTLDEANRVFDIFIDWARYAEIIAYDVNAKVLTLDETNAFK